MRLEQLPSVSRPSLVTRSKARCTLGSRLHWFCTLWFSPLSSADETKYEPCWWGPGLYPADLREFILTYFRSYLRLEADPFNFFFPLLAVNKNVSSELDSFCSWLGRSPGLISVQNKQTKMWLQSAHYVCRPGFPAQPVLLTQFCRYFTEDIAARLNAPFWSKISEVLQKITVWHVKCQCRILYAGKIKVRGCQGKGNCRTLKTNSDFCISSTLSQLCEWGKVRFPCRLFQAYFPH